MTNMIGAALLEVETSPGTWLALTGEARSITINRRAGDPGTLAAEVLNAAIDPTTSAAVARGKRVRVQVRNAAGTGWTPVFTSTLDNAETDHNPQAPAGKRVNVRLSGLDATARLANLAEHRGVATVNALRWLVGTTIPFTINGATTTLATGAVVGTSDSASLWDQILLARDTALGQAWIDPTGRLRVNDPAHIDTTSKATLGPDTYREINTDFSPSQLINSVVVNWRRYNIGTDTSVDVPYGPYEDTASVAQWGVRQAVFTIQGTTEDEPTIAAYANAVLAQFANPNPSPRSAVVPITSTARLALVRDIDLCSTVTVTDTTGANPATVTVAAVNHELTARGWLTTYEFTPTTAAAPGRTPATGRTLVPGGSVGPGELTGEVSEAIDQGVQAKDAIGPIEQAIDDFNDSLADRPPKTAATTNPIGNPGVVGAVWERYDTLTGARKLLAAWQWDGDSWEPVSLDPVYIPKIDVNTGTIGTLGVDRLLVGIGRNSIVNPGAETGQTAPHEAVNGASVFATTNPTRSGARGFRVAMPARASMGFLFQFNGPDATVGAHLPVQVGDVIRGEFYARYGAPSAAQVRAYLRLISATGAGISNVPGEIKVLTSGYQRYTVETTITDPTAAYVGLSLGANGSASGDVCHVDDARLEKKVTGELLVDGAIDGKTITGATLQTSATGNGVIIENDGAGGLISFRYGQPGIGMGVIQPYLGDGPELLLSSGFATDVGAAPSYINIRGSKAATPQDNEIHMVTRRVKMTAPRIDLGGNTYLTGAIPTTGAGANAYINSEGLFAKSTSSRRYKTAIEPLDVDPETLLALEPVQFRSTIETDDPERTFVGFIAEQADEIGLGRWVEYNADGQPESFAYASYVAATQHVLRHQRDQITELRSAVAALTDRLDALDPPQTP